MSSLPSMVKRLTPKTSNNMEKTTENIAAATKVVKEMLTDVLILQQNQQ